MKVPSLLLLVLLAISSSSTAEDANAKAILGVWRGTSICVNLEAAPACKNEEVIYEFRETTPPVAGKLNLRPTRSWMARSFRWASSKSSGFRQRGPGPAKSRPRGSTPSGASSSPGATSLPARSSCFPTAPSYERPPRIVSRRRSAPVARRSLSNKSYASGSRFDVFKSGHLRPSTR